MSKVVRFGVSIEEELLEGFDDLIAKKGYANRSEALRNLIRGMLLDVEVRERPDAEVVGTLTLVYDHDHGDLSNRLVDLQHRYHDRIISTLHVHIDEHSCLEVLIVRGRNDEVQQISDSLIGTRGVQQGKLIISTAETAPHHHSQQNRHHQD
ncbi:MAG: nickel-responsive transcriptional regulator NikR [Spirochaetaceae bacterium]|nr:MAG: nickel-responsive transcriptional regulator NikR [Spirochaetaceae bacterium]